MWGIGPGGGPPRNSYPSWDHGWSSGAAPALTSYVLGVRPTSPGFATFVVSPHRDASVSAASGSVPTPRGDIAVSWHLVNGKLMITVDAPSGLVWTNRPVTQTPAVTTKLASDPKPVTKQTLTRKPVTLRAGRGPYANKPLY